MAVDWKSPEVMLVCLYALGVVTVLTLGLFLYVVYEFFGGSTDALPLQVVFGNNV